MEPSIVGILIGVLCGAAIGVERQWSGHATGPESHFGGVRTFTLMGGLAGIAGYLWLSGFHSLAAVLLIGLAGVILIGYAAVSRRDLDATTEVAGLIVVAAGLLAGLGSWQLASGTIVITALLLVEKSRLHTLVAGISDVGIRAGFRFALMAVVILPLLPEGPYGPLGGIRPRELWLLVLFFSGLSFFVYVIRSLMGAGRGYIVAGVMGGLISSTNVTFTFSRMSQRETQAETPLALGVLAACAMMYLRVNLTTAVLNPSLGLRLMPYLLPPAAIGVGLVLWAFRQRAERQHKENQAANPLQLRSAIQMAVLFQIVMFMVTAVRERWGQAGTIASGAVLGFTDIDALVISMTKTAGQPDEVVTAAVSIVVGTISNTILKLGLAAVLGGSRFRMLVVAGLLGFAGLSVVLLLLVGH